MAVGEKRLFSLINATVSHDMRNPCNSIQAQLTEQQILNKKLHAQISELTPNNIKKTKDNLSRILTRQESCSTV